MNNLKRKTFINLAIFAILGSITLVVWVFGLYQISSMRESYADLSNKLEELEKEGQSSQVVKATLRNTEAGRNQINKFFVAEDTVVDFLSDIEEVGQLSVSEVELLSFQEEDRSLVLNLEASGKFNSVFDFTKLVELLPYKLHIRSIDMRYLGDVNDGEVVNTAQWRASYVLILESFLTEQKNEEA